MKLFNFRLIGIALIVLVIAIFGGLESGFGVAATLQALIIRFYVFKSAKMSDTVSLGLRGKFGDKIQNRCST